jgi:hypothetical protein
MMTEADVKGVIGAVMIEQYDDGVIDAELNRLPPARAMAISNHTPWGSDRYQRRARWQTTR